MNLSALRYLVSLAKVRHFGRAAEACFVSQPTLSIAIRKLEEDLGVAILERNRQEVRFTLLGEQLVVQAQRVLAEAAALQNMAQSGRDPLRVPLRLGVIFTVAPFVLPALVPALKQLAPLMPLYLAENYTHRLLEQLKTGQLDAALLALPLNIPDLEVEALYHEPFCIALPLGHVLSSQAAVHMQDLQSSQVLLLSSGNCFRDQVLSACPALLMQTGDASQTLEGSSLETICHMVASGLGVTILPSSASKRQDVCIKSIAGVSPKRTIALVWRKNHTRPAALACLAQALRTCVVHGVEWIK